MNVLSLARLYNNDNCNNCIFEAYSMTEVGRQAQCTKIGTRVENWSIKIRNPVSKIISGGFQNCTSAVSRIPQFLSQGNLDVSLVIPKYFYLHSLLFLYTEKIRLLHMRNE